MRTIDDLTAAFAQNLQALLGDAGFWVATGAGAIFLILVLALGAAVGRLLGFIRSTQAVAEQVAASLGIGLVVLCAIWASVWSGGRSAFTPIGIVFAAGIAAGTIKILRRDDRAFRRAAAVAEVSGIRRWVVAAAWCIGLASLLALIYGSTMAPSPRGGVQPVEFMDEVFYSVLATDLVRTGSENLYSPAGVQATGLPPQTWYHWGEIWLQAAVIQVTRLPAIDVRHFIVLPTILVSACLTVGSIIRRLTGTTSNVALLLGGAAVLVLAPIPIPGTWFGYWARGGIFGVTMYGLAVLIAPLVVLLALEVRRSLVRRVFVAGVAASLVPAHIVLALVAAPAWLAAVVVRVFVGRRALHLPRQRTGLVLPITAIAIGSIALAWGLLTGHGIGASGTSTTIRSFNASWREGLINTAVGAVVLWTPAVVLIQQRRRPGPTTWISFGIVVALVIGAIAWGARYGDFTMFHFFFGPLAVFATPVVALGLRRLWTGLRVTRPRAARLLAVVTIVQLEVGAFTVVMRLQEFGPHDYVPVPVAVLNEIEKLPPDATLAYRCQPLEELAFWNPRLLALYGHTGRRVVPMCFEAESFGPTLGGFNDPTIPAPFFEHAPQRALYPTSDARPSDAAVLSFLRDHRVGYVYADDRHPVLLSTGLEVIVDIDQWRVFRVTDPDTAARLPGPGPLTR